MMLKFTYRRPSNEKMTTTNLLQIRSQQGSSASVYPKLCPYPYLTPPPPPPQWTTKPITP